MRKRVGNFSHVDAERGRPFAVDVGQQIRFVHAQRGVDVDDARQLGHLIAQLVAEFGERLQVGAGDDKVDIDRRSLAERGEIANRRPEFGILGDDLSGLRAFCPVA